MKRIFKILVWSVIWLSAFWIFLIITFPSETVREWLVNKIQNRQNVKVSIERLALKWNMDVEFKAISVSGIGRNTNTSDTVNPNDLMVFTIKMDSLIIKPSLLSLARIRPSFDFVGNFPTGGNLSGSFNSGDLTLSFKDISFKDITLPSFPIPSSASISGAGRLKIVNSKGMIEIELDGISGGKQRIKVYGGESPSVEGKLNIMVLFR